MIISHQYIPEFIDGFNTYSGGTVNAFAYLDEPPIDDASIFIKSNNKNII